MDLLSMLFGATKEIGILQVLLLVSIVALGYMVLTLYRIQSRQIKKHEAEIKQQGEKISILQKDVDVCHKEKRVLMEQYRDLKDRCAQYDHRLGESLAREKVLSDLLKRLGMLGDKNIAS